MKDVRMLAALVIGVVLVAAVFSLGARDRRGAAEVEHDSGDIVRQTISDDGGDFVLRDGERTIKAKWRGEFKLNDLGTDVDTLENRLEISIEKRGVTERAEFKRGEDGVERRYFLDGTLQPENAETQDATADLVLRFLRASGVKAAERVAALLDQGGASAALDEFENLTGDHAMSRYAVEIAKKADLSPREVERLAAKLKTIKSDHDLAEALGAIVIAAPLTPETAPALIAAAGSIRSDYDLRRLAETFAAGKLDDQNLDAALGLFERMHSDHDLRIAATAFLEKNTLQTTQAARLLETAARRIDSDHDIRLVLTEAAPYFARGAEASAAWLEAFQTLDSSHDMRLALEEVAEGGGLGRDQWLALIDATTEIDSSHDRRIALETIAKHMERDTALLNAYRSAARKIESDSDRDGALEAIDDD